MGRMKEWGMELEQIRAEHEANAVLYHERIERLTAAIMREIDKAQKDYDDMRALYETEDPLLVLDEEAYTIGQCALDRKTVLEGLLSIAIAQEGP